MKLKLPTSKQRQYIYALVAALLGVLALYKVIDSAAVPLWLSLVGTLLGVATTSTAAVATKTQRANGTLPD